jgi:hypothetical protein
MAIWIEGLEFRIKTLPGLNGNSLLAARDVHTTAFRAMTSR